MIFLLTAAFAQNYSFPTSSSDYSTWYPTSYQDHGGNTDYTCASDTYSGHNGNDFGAGSWAGMSAGRDVTAAAAGTVEYVHDGERDDCAGNCSSGANLVQIRHPDGRMTAYGHLKKWSITVNVGDQVTCGQKIGEMGSSGMSSGPHLHIGVYRNGTLEDPFQGACGSATTSWVSQGAYQGVPGRVCDNTTSGGGGGGSGGGGCSAVMLSGNLALLLLPPVFWRRKQRS